MLSSNIPVHCSFFPGCRDSVTVEALVPNDSCFPKSVVSFSAHLLCGVVRVWAIADTTLVLVVPYWLNKNAENLVDALASFDGTFVSATFLMDRLVIDAVACNGPQKVYTASSGRSDLVSN